MPIRDRIAPDELLGIRGAKSQKSARDVMSAKELSTIIFLETHLPDHLASTGARGDKEILDVAEQLCGGIIPALCVQSPFQTPWRTPLYARVLAQLPAFQQPERRREAETGGTEARRPRDSTAPEGA